MYTKFSQNFNNLPLWQQVIKKDVRFEVKELIDNAGKVTSRQYDAVISGIRHEFKSWREWYSWSDDVIVEQLVKDLANEQIEKLSDLQWVFRRSEGITDIDMLRKKIVGALKKNESKIKQSVNKETVMKLFPEDKLIDDTNCIEKLIYNIDKPENFDKIFKIFEQ